jgi:Family of unknown function (DUF5781)
MRASSSKSENQADELVGKAFNNTKQLMTKAGYKIPDSVKVTVDPRLPFMGYTKPTRQGFNIVVAGGAVGGEMLEGLLMHEMGHIYRITTNHSSHNAQILEEAIDRLGANIPDYKQKIIHDLLNDIQDLYADDLLFKALRNSPVIRPDQMTEFLQSWVKDTPVNSGNTTQDRWANTSLMTHNARAIAQMERHHIEDTGGRAAKANQAFLNQVDPDIAGEFDYFRKTLLNLREDMTASDYRKLLAEYLDRFVRIAEKG